MSPAGGDRPAGSGAGWAGRVSVVTGAAAGIGRALAVEAARRGAIVVAADREPADATVAEIESAGGTAGAVRCDIRVQAEVDALLAGTLERHGAVHLLAANAGFGLPGALADVTPAQLTAVLDTNVVGTFRCLRTFGPALAASARRGEPASVLVTGSEHTLAVPPGPPMTAYTTSKHALLGLADCARRDLAGAGVTVTLLCPGWVLTEAVRAFLDTAPELAPALRAVAQEPAEVARVACDAVAAGRFLVPTTVHSAPASRARADALTAAFDRLNGGAA